MTHTAGQAIVDALEGEGVGHVYGLPGGHVLSIYDGLYASPSIRHILVRHEHAAACMAAAHAQLTGAPGVCLVTAGPGATNLLTGVAEAFVGSLPLIILSGRGSTATAHRGASQEVATDQIFAPVTKWAVRVDRADLVPDVIRQAFTIARGGRPGPVLIDLPRDVLDTEIARRPYVPAAPRPRPGGDPGQIDQAVAALLGAERPLLIAGGGVLAAAAAAQVRELAELLAIPVLTSLAGRGSIPDDHPLSAGGLGAHRTRLSKRLLGEADVILGLGTRFEEMETNWTPSAVPSPQATYIQVDIEPAEIGRSVPAQIGIVGDLRTVLEQVLVQLRARGGLAPGAFAEQERTREVAEEIAQIDAESEELARAEQAPMHPLAPIRAARAALPRKATVAFDVGCLAQHMAGAAPHFKIYEPRTTIVPSSFYGMGFAAAALPAARVVHPDRPALCFVGDGSFQMVMTILPVAAEHRLGVTWCVLDDGALGSIRDIQQYRFSDRIIGTEPAFQPDLAMLARACGCHGERVTDRDDVAGAIDRALSANADGVPAVLDFVVARERLLGSLEHYSFYPAELIEAARAVPRG
ncbi:MAG TPA: thiamine pyrophosphate-binding protein [Solirubrobacteraceae bacterium]